MSKSKFCTFLNCRLKTEAKQLCSNHYQQLRRKQTNNGSTHRYEKTINGYLMRTYNNMLGRVRGTQKEKAHLYKGLDILSREDFYSWSKNDKIFNFLFYNWEQSNYNRKLSPSIDRIDSVKGYLIDNIRWLTHSENSKLGCLSKRRTTTPIVIEV